MLVADLVDIGKLKIMVIDNKDDSFEEEKEGYSPRGVLFQLKHIFLYILLLTRILKR